MIDKELFPEEYEAVDRLKRRSAKYEQIMNKRKQEKLERIEECRRKLDAEYSQ